jgi:hypothetical protein
MWLRRNCDRSAKDAGTDECDAGVLLTLRLNAG